jgi:predicted ATP-binding protein involved in virulence
MQLTHLKVNNFRAFGQAEFEFKPGMNLIVGINGAGKSSVLDLLRIMLSRSLSKFAASKVRPLAFVEDDYKVGARSITAEMGFTIEGIHRADLLELDDVTAEDLKELANLKFTIHKNLERFIPSTQTGSVRSQTINLPDVEGIEPKNKNIPKKLKIYGEDALAVYYSTRRSIPTLAKSIRQSDALLHRELNLREFAEWWLVQKEGFSENSKQNLSAMETVVTSFLDNCSNLCGINAPETTLLIDKNGATLDVRQLSEGERGILALAFDLVRRSADMHGYSNNPLHEATGIVLIDEIDLHLHPRWQREVVEKLTTTFPKMQFIATTHSPQIVGEVPPENIIILEEGKQPYPAEQSLGMDTNWILEFLMRTKPRNAEFEEKLSLISDLIEDNDFEVAQRMINQLRDSNLARDPELVKLQARLTRYQILKDGEVEN